MDLSKKATEREVAGSQASDSQGSAPTTAEDDLAGKIISFLHVTDTDQAENANLIASSARHPALLNSNTLSLQFDIKSDEVVKDFATVMAEGENSFRQSQFDSAKASFAAALKIAIRDSELDSQAQAASKLGDAYMSDAGQSNNGQLDHARAAALYNYAINVKKKHLTMQVSIEKAGLLNEEIALLYNKAASTEINLLQSIRLYGSQDPSIFIARYNSYKDRLVNLRLNTKTIQGIITQENTITADASDESGRTSAETHYISATQELYAYISDELSLFFANLIDDCMQVLGPPPCKYAIIGLGSLAKNEATPYSDLEWAIIIDDKGQAECEFNKSYFRKLTQILHVRVINIGETILPSLVIPSLNEFADDKPEDNIYDMITPRGFSFDGLMPNACKWPLGRPSKHSQGKETQKGFELIGTVEELVSLVSAAVRGEYEPGLHLTEILVRTCLIIGDHNLLAQYRASLENTLGLQSDSSLSVRQKLALQLISADVAKFRLQLEDSSTAAHIYNVKNAIYRLPTAFVESMSLYFLSCAATANNWQNINALVHQETITQEQAHNLRLILAIAVNLRLSTYLDNNRQGDNSFSMLPQLEFEKNYTKEEFKADKHPKAFYLPSFDIIYRYYFTAYPIQDLMVEAAASKEAGQLEQLVQRARFYEDNKRVRGLTQQHFLLYFDAEISLTAWLEDNKDDFVVLSNLASICHNAGNLTKAVQLYLRQYKLLQEMHPTGEHPDIAGCLYNLGITYEDLNDITKAKKYLAKSLAMRQKIYGDLPHHDIATTYNSIGNLALGEGNFPLARELFERALVLFMYNTADNSFTNMAMCLGNIANAAVKMSDFNQALVRYKQSLSLYYLNFKNQPHPDIALCLNNLGALYNEMGQYQEALSCHKQALAIRYYIFKDRAHPDVASTLNNLACVYSASGDYKQAINFHKQALEMRVQIYGNKPHEDIAISANNLAKSLRAVGSYNDALMWAQLAVDMGRLLPNYISPNSANALSGLGNIWISLSKFQQALLCFSEANEILNKYFKEQRHIEIVESLADLGNINETLGNYAVALQHYIKAQQIMLAITNGQPHRHLGSILLNIGNLYKEISDFPKAKTAYEQALYIFKQCNVAHLYEAVILHGLGTIFSRLADYDQALTYLQRSLQLFKELHSNQPHEDMAMVYGAIAILFSNIGDYPKALEFHKAALLINQSIFGLGPNNYVADNLSNIGTVLQAQKSHAQAADYFWRAQKMLKEIYRDQPHPDVAAIWNNLANAYSSMGEEPRALRYFSRATAIQKAVTADNSNFPMALYLNNMGSACNDLGFYQKGIGYLEKSLEMRQRIYNNQPHPDTAASLLNLALCYCGLHDFAKALSLNHDSVEMYKITVGEGHPNTQNAINGLRLALMGYGMYAIRQGGIGMPAISQTISQKWNLPNLTDPNVYAAYIQEYRAQGKIYKLIEFQEVVVKLRPRSTDALCDLARYYHIASTKLIGNNRHSAQERGRLMQQASSCLNKALEIDLQGRVCAEYALFLFMQKDLLNAAPYLLNSLFGASNQAIVFGQLERNILPRSLQKELGLADTVTIDSKLLSAYLLFMVYKKLDRQPEALETLINWHETISSTPTRLSCSMLGYCYIQLGMYDAAITAFGHAHALAMANASVNERNYINKNLALCQESLKKIEPDYLAFLSAHEAETHTAASRIQHSWHCYVSKSIATGAVRGL